MAKTVRQKNVFLSGEGDAWYERNKAKLPLEDDPIMDAIKMVKAYPTSVLEIGCADGWRADRVKLAFGASYIGVEPSIKAATAGRQNGRDIIRGTASGLYGFRDGEFDCVIYGFCLYLCDRSELFRIAAEGDRVLKNNGLIVIQDFDANPDPHKVAYVHHDGIYSYKMDYAMMFLWNPEYIIRYKKYNPDTESTVWILQKDIIGAYEEPLIL